MRVIFFSERSKFNINSKISKKKKKKVKKVLVSETIASELVALNCPDKEENTYHWQSVCQQTVVKFCISVRETFSNSISCRVINKHDKGAVLQIATVLGTIYHVACQRVFLNGTFRYLSHLLFHSL